jgi:hypothetical protein
MKSTRSRRTSVTLLVLTLAIASLATTSAVFARGPRITSTVETQPVTIKAVSATGRLVGEARIGLFNDGYKFSKQTTGADGTVTFTGVSYGTYYVDFSHNPFCSAYHRITVDGSTTEYQIWAHPKGLWEGIGY